MCLGSVGRRSAKFVVDPGGGGRGSPAQRRGAGGGCRSSSPLRDQSRWCGTPHGIYRACLGLGSGWFRLAFGSGWLMLRGGAGVGPWVGVGVGGLCFPHPVRMNQRGSRAAAERPAWKFTTTRQVHQVPRRHPAATDAPTATSLRAGYLGLCPRPYVLPSADSMFALL